MLSTIVVIPVSKDSYILNHPPEFSLLFVLKCCVNFNCVAGLYSYVEYVPVHYPIK